MQLVNGVVLRIWQQVPGSILRGRKTVGHPVKSSPIEEWEWGRTPQETPVICLLLEISTSFDVDVHFGGDRALRLCCGVRLAM